MISLIIPMYNSEETIAGTLKSVIEQTVAFSEVIVVDNGSSDRSVEIVSGICQQYPHIHLFHCHEKGVSSARNMGLDVSQSPYIGFLDADDLLANDYVEIITASIKSRPDAEMYHFNFQQEFKNGIIKENPHFLNDKEIYSGSQFVEETLRRFSFEAKHMVWSFVFKAKFLKQYNLKFDKEMTIFEDILFLNKVWNENPQIIVINKSLITYIYVEKSLTNSGNSIKMVETLKKLKESLPNRSNYVKKLSSRILNHSSFKLLWGDGISYYILKIKYFYQRFKNKIKGRVL